MIVFAPTRPNRIGFSPVTLLKISVELNPNILEERELPLEQLVVLAVSNAEVQELLCRIQAWEFTLPNQRVSPFRARNRLHASPTLWEIGALSLKLLKFLFQLHELCFMLKVELLNDANSYAHLSS
jgi:hypothetical protein